MSRFRSPAGRFAARLAARTRLRRAIWAGIVPHSGTETAQKPSWDGNRPEAEGVGQIWLMSLRLRNLALR